MPTTEQKTIYIDGQPVEITLTKGQRGSYGWEVKIKGEDADAVIEKLKKADLKLRVEYPEAAKE